MTIGTKTNDVIGIFSITLKTFPSRQAIVTVIELRIVTETLDAIMFLFTHTEIVFIIKTETLSFVLTDVMISEDDWYGAICH